MAQPRTKDILDVETQRPRDLPAATKHRQRHSSKPRVVLLILESSHLNVAALLSEQVGESLLSSLIKIRGFTSTIAFYLFLFVCFDLVLRLFGFGYPSHYQEENIQRYPYPYDMFRGKPLARDHNKFGFRGPDPSQSNDQENYRIAFFGGSSGYNGAPPIIDRLVLILQDDGLSVSGFNFSSVSSNHNQHLHRLVEFLDTKFDLVIFYGGSNESFQNYFYDPRPGYPYNYFVRNNLSPLRLFLIRYSAFFGELDKLTGWISGLSALRIDRDENFETWLNAIIDNYVRVHKNARMITENSLAPSLCTSPMYLPVLQPTDSAPELAMIYDKLAEKSIRSVEGLIDLRHLSNKLAFRDFVHVDEMSKQIIAEELAPIVQEMLIGCRRAP